jgi:hypothetical protein
LTAILSFALITQLLMPISVETDYINIAEQEQSISQGTLPENDMRSGNKQQQRFFRTGLFKSAIALQGKPLADKTIERIKSQLKLQCIMTLNGQLVAYIQIKDVGMKKCAVGDTVSDMFTVLNIDKAKKSVDISIIDHKVTLYM